MVGLYSGKGQGGGVGRGGRRRKRVGVPFTPCWLGVVGFERQPIFRGGGVVTSIACFESFCFVSQSVVQGYLCIKLR